MTTEPLYSGDIPLAKVDETVQAASHEINVRLEPTGDVLYDLWVNKDKSYRELADMFKLSYSTIRRRIKFYQTKNGLEGKEWRT